MTDEPFKLPFWVFEAPFPDEEDRFYVLDSGRWKASWHLTRDKAQWLCNKLNAPAAAVGDWHRLLQDRIDFHDVNGSMAEAADMPESAAHHDAIQKELQSLQDAIAAVPAVPVQVTEEEQAAIAEARKRDTNSAASADAWRTEYDQNRADLLAIIDRHTRTTPSGEWQEIATAPKREGARFQVWMEWLDTPQVEIAQFKDGAWRMKNERVFWDWPSTATHWRELPAPPIAGIGA